VASGVPEQPCGFTEIVTGARNRARAALESSACDLAVGIEDGLVTLPGVDAILLNIGCVALTDGVRFSIGLSSSFGYPPACAQPALEQRAPIGALFDRLWAERCEGRMPSASDAFMGNVGRLTHGILPRAEYTRHAVVCALVSFLNPDLYPEGATW